MAAKATAQAFEIRPLAAEHLHQVVTLERQCFEFPWRFRDFYSMLTVLRGRGVVALAAGKMVGYAIYSPLEGGWGFAQLDNLAVAPTWRRQGVGSALVKEAVRRAGLCWDAVELTALVRERNLSAQLFLRSSGFTATQVLRGVYNQTGEDAYLFRLRSGVVIPATQEFVLT